MITKAYSHLAAAFKNEEHLAIAAVSNKRLPYHIGLVPDGNRRWAQERGLPRQAGYGWGIQPGFRLYHECLKTGIREVSIYGFTKDNTKSPRSRKMRLPRHACRSPANSMSGVPLCWWS